MRSARTSTRSFKAEILEGFHSGEKGEWQCQVERLRDGANQVLLLRGTRLPDISGGGGVVVFDDITSLLQAQRTAAWGEVARRLAHEIKNPLTPIQLSAERVQHKLAEKLSMEDAQILRRSTETIVNQVEALKKMVNEFSEYARAPELEFHLLDFNGLVRKCSHCMRRRRGHLGVRNRTFIWPGPRFAGGERGFGTAPAGYPQPLAKCAGYLIDVAEPAIMVRTEVVAGRSSV